VATLIALLLFSAVGVESTDLAYADPYFFSQMGGTIPAPEGTNPPVITFLNVANQSVFSSDDLVLTFSAFVATSNNITLTITELYYANSWQIGTTVFNLTGRDNYDWPSQFSINLTNVPKGPQWIEVSATATAFAYFTDNETQDFWAIHHQIDYAITTISKVDFTVGVSPSILSVSLENETFNESSVPLSVLVNEPIEQASYSLDGHRGVAFDGNATLSGLTNGKHSITVYLIDESGVSLVPKTVYFSVRMPEPFPTLAVVAVVSTVSLVVALSGFLLYRRHRKTANLSNHLLVEGSEG
jgi:hypothetical protein